jgi:predicted Zn-dependent protease
MWLPDRFKKRLSGRLRRGDARGADSLARKYIDAFPAEEAGWQGLALAQRRAGNFAGAELAMREAVAVSPTAWNRYNLARALVEQDKNSEAQAILEQLAVDSDPNAAFLGHLGLAADATHVKDWDRALLHARAAAGSMPNDRARWALELASIVSDIPGQEPWAEELLRERIAAKPGDARGYVMLAVLVEERDPAQAASLLRTAKKHWPGDPSEMDRFLPGLREHQRRLRAPGGTSTD